MNNSIYIDIGNTYVKTLCQGVFDSYLSTEFDINRFKDVYSEMWLSSVNTKFSYDENPKIHVAKTSNSYKTLINHYEDYHQLGVDRWLNLITAYENYPKKNALIIDVGSAVTIDYLESSGDFRGGIIMPGLSKLRNSFDKFANTSSNILSLDLKKNTQDAWNSGSSHMFISAVNEAINQFEKQFKIDKVLITGGDSQNLAPYLDKSVIVEPYMTLQGLKFYSEYVG